MVPESRVRQLAGAVIIAQLLPAGTSIKGGVGLKMRLGERGTRATRDLDVAAADPAKITETLTKRLAEGWGSVPASRPEAKADPAATNRPLSLARRENSERPHPPQFRRNTLLTPYRASLNFLSANEPIRAAPWRSASMSSTAASLLPGTFHRTANRCRV